MRFRLGWLVAGLLVGVMVLAAAVSGCASAGSSGGPGLRTLRGGRVEAVGTLVRIDLEGGFWVIKDATPGASAANAGNVIVLANGDDVNAKALEGRYVRAVGTPLEGASGRLSGQEMRADSLEEVAP